MIKTTNKKQCSRCKKKFPLEKFAKNRAIKGGYQSYCKICWCEMAKEHRSKNKKTYNAKARVRKQVRKINDPTYQKREQLRQLYNLSMDDYKLLLKKQNGKCAICKKKPLSGRHKTLCVDHDHETGKVRGLLCWNCNMGLGMLGDSFQSLEKALQYLEDNS